METGFLPTETIHGIRCRNLETELRNKLGISQESLAKKARSCQHDGIEIKAAEQTKRQTLQPNGRETAKK